MPITTTDSIAIRETASTVGITRFEAPIIQISLVIDTIKEDLNAQIKFLNSENELIASDNIQITPDDMDGIKVDIRTALTDLSNAIEEYVADYLSAIAANDGLTITYSAKA